MASTEITLPYARKPAFGHLILTPRPGGLTIEVLPQRPLIHIEIAIFVLYTLIVGLGLVAFNVQSVLTKWYQWALVVPFCVAGAIYVGLRLTRSLQTQWIETDRMGLRLGLADPSRLRKLIGARRGYWARERITDIVATRRVPNLIPFTFYLQLRLSDGQSIILSYGMEEEIRWLAHQINGALTPMPKPEWMGGDSV